jgi:pimeloyl-ACP methyl ester carboxylesterase
MTLGRVRTLAVGHFTSAAAHDRFQSAYDTAMRALPQPDRILDLRTTYGTVRLYRFDGTTTGQVPLVLLPGRASASPVWAANLHSLVRQAPVYTVDLLGEPGRSVQDRPITSADDQAQWLHEVLTQLPEPEVDLLGVSIGGWTAMNLVVHRGAKVRSIILLDPVLVFAPISIATILHSIPAGIRWLPQRWRDRFTSWTAGGAPVEDVPIARMIEAGMQSYVLEVPAPRQIPQRQLASLDLPVLVIVAGRSRMHDPDAVAATARRALRSGQVRVYAFASHAINGEYPDRIARDVGTFRRHLAERPLRAPWSRGRGGAEGDGPRARRARRG